MARTVLVDVNEDRARRLARRVGAAGVETDYRRVLARVDGVLVTAPPSLHYRIVLDCVERGVHVLCEKPLCETEAEAQAIIAATQRAGVQVGVNNTRRLYPASRRVRELIGQEAIGRLEALEFHEGDAFGWPTVSGFHFGAQGGSRGVLEDRGAHVIDLVCWWLGGRPDITAYHDDSFGGSEAVAHVALHHRGCTVDIKLSWLSSLKNAYGIRGTGGSIEGRTFDWRVCHIQPTSGKRMRVRCPRGPATADGFANLLVDNFLETVLGAAEPLIPARDVVDSIAVIEACYSGRSRFDMPWHSAMERINHVA